MSKVWDSNIYLVLFDLVFGVQVNKKRYSI